MGWTCSHQRGQMCDLLKIVCDPGTKGCVLYGKALFADPSTPSNEAIARREAMEAKKKEDAMKRLIEEAKRGF